MVGSRCEVVQATAATEYCEQQQALGSHQLLYFFQFSLGRERDISVMDARSLWSVLTLGSDLARCEQATPGDLVDVKAVEPAGLAPCLSPAR